MGYNLSTFGKTIASMLQGGEVIFLRGEMGSGKTYLARYIIRALCEDQNLIVSSPTFCLLNTYEAKELVIHHWDLYRVEKAHVGTLNLPEHIHNNSVVIIEWPEILSNEFTPSITVTIHEHQCVIDAKLLSQ